MGTYDWAWIENQAAQTEEVWHRSAGYPIGIPRFYTPEEQDRNEEAYDEALFSVEDAVKSLPLTKRKQTETIDRIVAAFARFSAKALSLDDEATHLLTRQRGNSRCRKARFQPPFP